MSQVKLSLVPSCQNPKCGVFTLYICSCAGHAAIQPEEEKIDLDIAYARYPRKEGKTRGMKTLRSKIKTQAQFVNLLAAIDRYKKAKKDKDPEFLMLFSTFANNYQDWLDPDAGTVSQRTLESREELSLADQEDARLRLEMEEQRRKESDVTPKRA